MKVVLKQDVKSIGKKDELHEVSDGYARNYLLPRGLAVAADAAAVNEVRTKAAASEHHAAEELANAQALAKKLNGQIVAIKAKAGQGGRCSAPSPPRTSPPRSHRKWASRWISARSYWTATSKTSVPMRSR
mgnify:CR=1 FL=1